MKRASLLLVGLATVATLYTIHSNYSLETQGSVYLVQPSTLKTVSLTHPDHSVESHLSLPAVVRLINDTKSKKNTVSGSQPDASAQTKLDNVSLGLLHDIKRCSVSMGVSRETLNTKQNLMISQIQNATLLLSSLKEVLPDHQVIVNHKNPCWKTFFKVSTGMEHMVGTAEIRNTVLQNHVPKVDKCPDSKKCVHCLPYFFIAGFPKSGTTTLHSVLSHHPQITPPLNKEPQWWSRVPLGDLSADFLKARTMIYLHIFQKATTQFDTITYDASQSFLFESPFGKEDYCLNAAVFSRILPNIKFIILMRNPVDRLYSSYYAFGGDYSEWPKSKQLNASLYFHNLVKNAIGLYNKCLSQGESVYECVDLVFRKSEVTLTLGMYYVHILKWTQFYSLENFLFLKTEDMTRNPSAVMRSITEFLGIKPVSEKDIKSLFSKQENTRNTFLKHKYRDMMPETRKLLSDFYASYNKQLVELIGDEQFSWS